MGTLFSINSPLWNFMDKVLHLLLLNLLWFLCCIPVVTIGASTTALYSVMLRYTRNQEGYLIREFFQAFRQNFLPSTIVWFVMAGAGVFLGVDAIVYLRSSAMGIFDMILMTAFCTAVLMYVFVNLYIYALIAAFQNTIFHLLKNALLLSICHWPASLLMIVGGMGLFTVGMLIFPPVLFVGFAVFSYFCSKYFNRMFARLAEYGKENMFTRN